jgi:replicative DNA helicase
MSESVQVQNAQSRFASSTSRHRPLPHDLGCEASILGGVILRNEELANLADLEIDDFYLHHHKVVFSAMRTLEAKHVPIDVTTLDAEIKKLGASEAIGGIAFLGELALRVPTPDNVRHYRDITLQLSKNRRAILKLAEATERAYSWQHDPSELIAEITGDLQRFDSDRPSASRSRSSARSGRPTTRHSSATKSPTTTTRSTGWFAT